MANIYECEIVRTTKFLVRANNEDDAFEWCLTHDNDDVIALTPAFDNDWEENITFLRKETKEEADHHGGYGVIDITEGWEDGNR